MFWRGGPTPTADGNVSLVAGTTLGGGTTINWTNCLRTRPWVREQWAEHGLGDVGEPAFDRHLDAVLEPDQRQRSVQRPERRPSRRLRGGRRGRWAGASRRSLRNTDRGKYSPETGGVTSASATSPAASGARTGPGSQTRRSTRPRFLTFTRATRVLAEGGRAAGVEAVWQPPGRARARKVTVHGPHGSSSPADRSSRPRCCCARESVAPRSATTCGSTHRASSAAPTAPTSEAWWGAAAGRRSAMSSRDTGDGYGFLIETAQYAPGLIGSATPLDLGQPTTSSAWRSFASPRDFISLTRDRGAGQVTHRRKRRGRCRRTR